MSARVVGSGTASIRKGASVSVNCGDGASGPFVVSAGGSARGFALEPPAPSVGPGAARVSFDVGRAARVRLSVLDVAGRVVTVLAEGDYPAGHYDLAWDGAGSGGRSPAGIYFVRFEWPGASATRRLVRVR